MTRCSVTDARHGAFFIHRTGPASHGSFHGMGPDLDNLETRETRLLNHGVGCSIEPGICCPGEIDVRPQIDLVGAGGRDVSTPRPQTGIAVLLPP